MNLLHHCNCPTRANSHKVIASEWKLSSYTKSQWKMCPVIAVLWIIHVCYMTATKAGIYRMFAHKHLVSKGSRKVQPDKPCKTLSNDYHHFGSQKNTYTGKTKWISMALDDSLRTYEAKRLVCKRNWAKFLPLIQSLCKWPWASSRPSEAQASWRIMTSTFCHQVWLCETTFNQYFYWLKLILH